MRTLFVTGPAEIELPAGWRRGDTPRLHRAAFKPEHPGDYPLSRVLDETSADAVLLLDPHRAPHYPRSLNRWHGLKIAHVIQAGGAMRSCAFRWFEADVVIWPRDPTLLGRRMMPPVVESLVDALAVASRE